MLEVILILLIGSYGNQIASICSEHVDFYMWAMVFLFLNVIEIKFQPLFINTSISTYNLNNI